MRPSRARRGGFTLIELLVVIAIIGLLATVVAFNVGKASDDAFRTKARADLTRLEEAVDLHRMTTKKYPQRLEELVTSGAIRKLQLDPWDHPYHYTPPAGSRRFVIASYGADGVPGGEGDAADISTSDDETVARGR